MKTTWKRLSAMVLALCMVLSLVSASAWAANDLTITVESVTAAPGDTVAIAVNVTNNPGFAGAALQFELADGVVLATSEGDEGFANDGLFQDGMMTVNSDEASVALLNGKEDPKEAGGNAGENVAGDGKLLTLYVVAPQTPDTYTINVKCKEGKESNISDKDSKSVKASFVAGTLTVQTAAHVHDWDEVKYDWSADNSTVTATRKCKTCEFEEKEEVKTTNSVTRNPTFKVKGERTYTAEFKNTAFQTQTKKAEMRLLGDLDGNGEIGTKDANKVFKAAAGKYNIEKYSDEWYAADADGNGDLGTKDANKVFKAAAGKI